MKNQMQHLFPALALLALAVLNSQFSTAFAQGTLAASARWEGPGAGSDSVVLAANSPTTAWTASANVSWLHLNAANQSGTGSTNVVFTCDPNPPNDANAGATRTGTLTIAGQTLTVNQAGYTYTAAAPGQALQLVWGEFNQPQGVAVDSAGNIYIADSINQAVYEWMTPNGPINTLVSTGLDTPQGVAVDSAGNVYIADPGNQVVCEWTAPNGPMTTLVSGLNQPVGVAVDGTGNVYIADAGNNAIYEWRPGSPSTSYTTLVPSASAMPPAGFSPSGVAVDAAGDVYVADSVNAQIDEWTAANSGLFTLVSSAPTQSQGFTRPSGVAVDGAGNVYVSDYGSQAVYEWTAATGNMSLLVPEFYKFSPAGVAVDGAGNVYLADVGNGQIEEVPLAFVDLALVSEPAAGGGDSLPPVLPTTSNLSGPFAPAFWLDGNSMPWLTITGTAAGVVSFDVSENTSTSPQNGHFALLNVNVPAIQAASASGPPSPLYLGNSMNNVSGGPDGQPPLVILGGYSPAGPLPGSWVTLPTGTINDVQFYQSSGDQYNFTVYVLQPLGPGPNPAEQQFQVVASQSFSGTASTDGTQILPASGLTASAGDLLAFAGIGPYYNGSIFGNDFFETDATYEDSSDSGSFTATPPGGAGTTFVVGANPDPNANYEYIPDYFQNQGRIYAIGVDITMASDRVSAAFTGLTPSQSITSGATAIALAGKVSGPGQVYPLPGEPITVTIRGIEQTTTINDDAGDFSFNYNPSGLPASPTPYTIAYSYAGDAGLTAASDSSTTLTVGCPTITLSPATLPEGTYGVGYSQPVAANGSTATPYTFAVTTGTLPAGLSLDSNSGYITGTPTKPGLSTVTITATDEAGCTGYIQYTLQVVSAYAQLQVLLQGESTAPNTTTGKTGTPIFEVAGSSYNVVVNAVDANFNLSPLAHPTLTLSAPTDPLMTISGTGVSALGGGQYSVTLSGGTATVQVTFNTPGTQTIMASDPVSDSTDMSSEVPVNSPGLVLFVTTAGANSLSAVSASGTVSTFFVASGSGLLDQPQGMTFDNSGGLYVANYGNSEILKITPERAVEMVVPEGYVNKPTGLAYDPGNGTVGNGTLYIAGNGNSKISRLPDGTTVPALFANASGPEGLAFDSSADILYVANKNNNSISELSSGGGLFGNIGLESPLGLGLDSQGDLYIASSLFDQLGIVVSGETYVEPFAGQKPQFTPWGIALDPSGNVFVANSGNGTISEITSDGSTAATFATGLSGVQWLVAAEAPIAPANIEASRANGQCGASVNLPTAAGFPAPGMAYSFNGNPITSPYLFPVGVSTVSFIASNFVGAISSSFTVTVAGNPPVAGPNSLTALENHATSLSVASVLQNDSAPAGGTLSILSVFPTTADDGSATLANGNITYTPPTGFIGTDVIYYTLSDGCATVTGSITVTVNIVAVMLQVLLPGETAAPNTPSGKTGTPTTQVVGTPFTVTVNAVDANYRVAPAATETVTISAPDDLIFALSGNPGNQVTLVNGTAMFQAVFYTAGLQMVEAQATGLETGLSDAVGATESPTVTCPGSQSYNAAAGQSSQSVSFMATATGYPAPSLTYAINGTAITSPYQFPAGLTVVTCTAANMVGSDTCNFTIGVVTEPVKLQVLLPGETAAPNTLTGKTGTPDAQLQGQPFYVTVNAVDANYNLGSAATPTVTITAPNDLKFALPGKLGNQVTLLNGSARFEVVFNTTGTQTVSVMDTAQNSPLTTGFSTPIQIGPFVPSCDYPPDGLVSWWRAENNTFDVIGGNTGTLENGAGYAAGEAGQAFSFTADQQMVVVGPALNLQLQNFTMEAWIQRGSASAVTSDSTETDGHAQLFGFGQGGYALGLTSGGSPLLMQVGSGSVSAGSAVLTDTLWHHVAVTSSGGTVIFYVDGTAYPGGTFNPAYTFTTSAAVGGRADNLNADNNDSFLGGIDELSVYNRALAGSEIVQIFNAGAAGKCIIPIVVSWPQPADIYYGTPLSEDQLNATANMGTQIDPTANAGGSFTYSPPIGTVLPAGMDQTLSVSFTPDDTADYPNPVKQAVAINVNPATVTITPNSQSKAYGQTVTFTGTEFSFVRYSGMAFSSPSSSTLVGSDSITSVTLSSPGAAATAHVAPAVVGPAYYNITAANAVGSGLANYLIVYEPGELVITPVPLTITANAVSIPSGDTALMISSLLTASFSGFINGDTSASLTSPPMLSTSATTASSPGEYPIDVTGASDPDYNISYVDGTLIVGPSTWTVTTAGTAAAGQTATVTLPPSPAQGGVTATVFNNSGSQSVTVEAAYYSGNPIAGNTSFGLASTYLDLEAAGAVAGDSMTAYFYSPYTASTPAPTLMYYTGTAWAPVYSDASPKVPVPVLQNGNWQYTVIFDGSSTPSITQLTGTVFALAIPAPALNITQSVISVCISWPDISGYTLQQNSDLTVPADWTASGYPITTANGTNSVTITPPAGNLFFRLVGP